MRELHMSTIEELTRLYKRREKAMLTEFFQFLSFPSISTAKSYRPHLLACADWLIEYLEKIGFKTALWETPGYPIVFGEWNKAGPDKPTLLIYNHYDVQPVEPLDEWTTPPFDPSIRDGAVYARGAQDNKGQCFYVLQALRLLMERDGKLPLNVKICIEGEEECGSAGIQAVLDKHSKELRADYLAVVDLGIRSPTQPALTLGLRGVAMLEVEALGSNIDLHSGMHGGLAYNPIHALVEVLSKLRDAQGKIAVPGFYDDVVMPSPEELSNLDMSFDAEAYQRANGIPPTGGEQALSPMERNWLRPTIELNGISGGYTDEGGMSVIPAKACAKIRCRLVPNQDPVKSAHMIAGFLEFLAPEGIQIKATVIPGGGPAVRTSANSKATQAFSKALSEVFETPCKFILEGASIPVVVALAKTCGGEPVLLGLGLASDCIHAPNEHFSLDRLEKGAVMFARGMEILGEKE